MFFVLTIPLLGGALALTTIPLLGKLALVLGDHTIAGGERPLALIPYIMYGPGS